MRAPPGERVSHLCLDEALTIIYTEGASSPGRAGAGPVLSSIRKGRYPAAEWVAIPADHWMAGNEGRKAVCLHVTEGSAASAIARFKGADRVSSHFLVTKTGHVYQFVSVYDTAYANGLSWSAWRKCWIDPEGALLNQRPPTWRLISPPTNPNFQTISVEHEGMHAQPWPSAQYHASIALLQWIAAQFPALTPYIPGETLIGHKDISPVNRPNCPGRLVNYATIANDANKTPAPLPVLGYYRVLGVPVYNEEDCTGPRWGYLEIGAVVAVDKFYGDPSDRAHLADGRGFVKIDDSLEAV